MLDARDYNLLRQMADGLCAQFGSNCEVVIHELNQDSTQHSVAYIVNGHVSGRRVGDGPSQVVLEQLQTGTHKAQDHYAYLTRTPDGKILKSTTLYIRDQEGEVAALFCVNFDISAMALASHCLEEFISPAADAQTPERIPSNVTDLLDSLIEESVRLVGKPVSLMTKEDKVRAIQFLNRKGAFLITKSGDKVAKFYGISKYTLYSYLDLKTGGENHD